MRLPSKEVTIALPKMHPGQAQVDKCDARFIVLDAGRRWGKDIYSERKLIKYALKARQPVAWFAPTYRMLLENWRRMRNILAPATLRASDQEHRIDLVTGNPLEMWSLDNFDAARGRGYGGVIINEAAMVPHLEDAWYMVIRPTLAVSQGWAMFPSTPRGLNFFHTLWRKAEDDKEWARFRFKTDDNPYISRDEIRAMRSSLPARVVRQEIDAEFVEDGAYFQKVDQAAVIEHPDLPDQHKGHMIIIGVDWGQMEDWTVITAGCRQCNRVVDWDRFQQIDFTYQREKLVSMATKWNAAVLPERNSIGVPNIEMLLGRVRILYGPDKGRGFNTTPTSKPPLIQSLANAIEHEDFKVPMDYADELRSYQVEMTTSKPKFSAPSGFHDDRVISLALCWWAMSSYMSSPFGAAG